VSEYSHLTHYRSFRGWSVQAITCTDTNNKNQQQKSQQTNTKSSKLPHNIIPTNKTFTHTHIQSDYTNTTLKPWFRRLICHPARKWIEPITELAGPILGTNKLEKINKQIPCFLLGFSQV